MEIGIEEQDAVLNIPRAHPAAVSARRRSAHDVGDGRVRQHAPAIRQRRDLHAHHAAIGPAEIKRRGIARLADPHALVNKGLELGVRYLIGTSVAAVMQQGQNGWMAVGNVVRQAPSVETTG